MVLLGRFVCLFISLYVVFSGDILVMFYVWMIFIFSFLSVWIMVGGVVELLIMVLWNVENFSLLVCMCCSKFSYMVGMLVENVIFFCLNSLYSEVLFNFGFGKISLVFINGIEYGSF